MTTIRQDTTPESFEEIWESWDKVAVLEPTGDPRQERRHAFYAGAIGLMGVFLGLSSSPGDAAYFWSIRRELEAFTESLLTGRAD